LESAISIIHIGWLMFGLNGNLGDKSAVLVIFGSEIINLAVEMVSDCL